MQTSWAEEESNRAAGSGTREKALLRPTEHSHMRTENRVAAVALATGEGNVEVGLER